jgi:hypothetical protein
MPILAILFGLYLLISSLNAISYLIVYLKLYRTGETTSCEIISIKTANFILSPKKCAIPKVIFTTIQQEEITDFPTYSWLVGVNDYFGKKDCTVIYNIKRPNQFVVVSDNEVVANILLVMIAIIFGLIQFA